MQLHLTDISQLAKTTWLTVCTVWHVTCRRDEEDGVDAADAGDTGLLHAFITSYQML